MNTNINNRIESNDVKVLIAKYHEIMVKVNNIINTKTYTDNYNRIVNVYTLNGMIPVLSEQDFEQFGSKTIKRFKRYLNKANNLNITTINKLLYIVHKYIRKSPFPTPKIVCEKHESIQKLKKDFIKAQRLADDMYKLYNIGKGDFYKQIK